MLTNTRARAAKPRSTRYEITCDALPGFILRVPPTGRKVFYARFRDAAGMDHRQRLGRMGLGFGADEARREAQVSLALRKAEARAGEPAPRLQASSATKYRSTPRLHILPALGDRRLADTSTADAADSTTPVPTAHAERTGAPEMCTYRIATPACVPEEQAANARPLGQDTAQS